MEILTFPNPLLLTKCDEVTVFGEELKIILEAMFETMKNHNGLGLAANQVGLPHRMFVMEGPEGEKLFLVNPKIARVSIVNTVLREGCLSAPGDFVELTDRVSWVQVDFQDETGKHRRRVFKELWSVCVQHEIEHLNGETFMKNRSIPKDKRKELAKKWNLSK